MCSLAGEREKISSLMNELWTHSTRTFVVTMLEILSKMISISLKVPHVHTSTSLLFLYFKITLVCRARELDKTIKIFILILLIWCNAITRSKLSWHNDLTKKAYHCCFFLHLSNHQRLKLFFAEFYFFVHRKVNDLISHQIQNIWSALHLEWILIRSNCNNIHLSTAFLYWFNYSH